MHMAGRTGDLPVDLVRCQVPGAFIKRFNFKAVRLIYDLHPFRLNGQLLRDGKIIKLWAQDHEGWLTMDGSAELA